MKRIVVIDGMGGGIGAGLIEKLKQVSNGAEIIALGANGVAAERMVKAGAARGASGENAIKVSVAEADFILGPIGIVIGNSMMGEISPAVAEAILAARGERILLPLQNEHFILAGLENQPLSRAIEKAAELLRERLEKNPDSY
jgi:hypothetical protein